jgi:hypothetical protein
MAVSENHIALVRQMAKWVAAHHFAGDAGAILVDNPESPASSKPPGLGGYVPDLYAPLFHSDAIVVGEAKTARDVESHHTYEQLRAFLGACASRRGSVLVVAVPWQMARCAANMVRILKSRTGHPQVSTVVLEQLEG